jgi:hypothetical protein
VAHLVDAIAGKPRQPHLHEHAATTSVARRRWRGRGRQHQRLWQRRTVTGSSVAVFRPKYTCDLPPAHSVHLP